MKIKDLVKFLQLKWLEAQAKKLVKTIASSRKEFLELITTLALLKMRLKAKEGDGLEFPLEVDLPVIKTPKGIKLYLFIHNENACPYPLKVKVSSIPYRLKQTTVLLHIYLVVKVEGGDI